jgi:acetyl esterase
LNDAAIAYQLLLYPITDISLDYASFQMFGESGYLLSTRAMDWFVGHYIDGADSVDWRAAPINASQLSGLPPAMVVTAEFDPLRDEGEAYAQRLADPGVPVTVHRAMAMCHGFLTLGVDEANRVSSRIGDVLRVAIGQ